MAILPQRIEQARVAVAEAQTDVIRKKLVAAKADQAEGRPGADRAWRLALARSARDLMKLPLDVVSLTLERRSVGELLELPPERALIGVLEGPQQTMGLWVACPTVLSALIEVQTLGRVSTAPAVPRKPTRTDAAMVAEFADAALKMLESSLAEEPDLIWAGGFRYASFLDDPRPLGLLLEDEPYRVLRAEVSLAGGAKSGTILMALPAEGRGSLPVLRAEVTAEIDPGPIFTAQLADRVNGADSQMEAVLARLTLPISVMLALQSGEILPLPLAALDRITLEGIDGRRLAMGKLGQNRGMRAVRLTPEIGLAAAARPGSVLSSLAPAQFVLRQTGAA
jgi:flagellar motor switch protein FliM